RQDLDRLSVPLQAAGPQGAPGPLRALPAALRMEPLVRLARLLAGLPLGCEHGGGSSRREPGRPRALPPRPVRRRAAVAGAHGALAILVHPAGGEAAHRRLVGAPRGGLVRARRRAAAGRRGAGVSGRPIIAQSFRRCDMATSLTRRGFTQLLGLGAASSALRPALALAKTLPQAPQDMA